MTEKEMVSSCTLLQTIFGDSTLKSLSEYHTFLQSLTNICLSDHREYILLCGPAYDSLPPLYKLFDFGNGHITAKPCLTAQYAFVVSKKLAVLEDLTVDYNQEYRLLLYATPAKEYHWKCDASMVILHLSGRTHSLVQQEEFRSLICESTVVKNDLHQVPQFYISSRKYEACFQRNNTQLLLYQLPGFQLDIQQFCGDKLYADSNKLSYDDCISMDDAGLWCDSDKLSIGALKKTPAIRCLEWPLCAVSWTTRSRTWPNNALIQDVVNSPVFLKPHLQGNISCSESQFDEDQLITGIDELLWSFDFSTPESVLLAQISTDAKRVFILLLSLADDSSKMYTALKHVLLWCIEEYGPDLETKASGLNGKLMLVISKLEGFMSNSGVPHYFIPESFVLSPESVGTNYMCQIFGAEKSHLHQTLLETTGMVTLLHVKDLTFCSNIMFKNMQEKLYSATEHNSIILCMQLYQKLHSFDTAWKSIASHHQILSQLIMLNDLQCPEIHKILIDFVQTSLGGMYVVQGIQAYHKQERRTFFNKAEEHFAAVQNLGMVVNKLRKAMMLLKREQFQLVLDTLEELFRSLYTEALAKEMEEDMPKYVTDVSFITALENAATYAILNMDYLVMAVEKPGLSKEMSTNLSLAEFQLLGFTPHPVAVLDTAVLCGIILSYSYSSLKRYTDAKKALEKVEGMSLKDEVDLNERRGCFYLNVIAHAYKKAKDIDQARYLLERSVTIMNSARNPGRWALMSLNSRKMKNILWGGIGVAMVTTVAAVTLSFVFGKK
ncbi:hypothetical protein LSH36_12g15010 [Paralvinella palmiformis]|uniref:Uncharacterized protein n=1 Tax=Paralvinella palmiformis TaxID=53620 RepID=A0AAD9KDL1_9ANNE|nr:hypothetical protein LSH36_12g15010 [Paralvinella palmiformis]